MKKLDDSHKKINWRQSLVNSSPFIIITLLGLAFTGYEGAYKSSYETNKRFDAIQGEITRNKVVQDIQNKNLSENIIEIKESQKQVLSILLERKRETH